MLYEKLGDREKALRFLESKAGRSRFTPDTAAPYLKMLARDVRESDMGKVWSMLSMPTGPEGWICKSCDRRDERIRWFCPSCLGFDTYIPRTAQQEVV